MILLGVLGPAEAPVGLLRRAEVLEPHAPPDTLVAGRPAAAVLLVEGAEHGAVRHLEGEQVAPPGPGRAPAPSRAAWPGVAARLGLAATARHS